MKEITKLEKTSLSDFTLCKAELLHTEERKSSVLHGLFVPLKRHDGKCEK